MLSIKPERIAVIIGNTIKIFVGEYLSSFAITSARYVKKPASDRAVTIINIPNRSPMVSQFTKPIASFRLNILNKRRRNAPIKATTVLFIFSEIITA